MRFDVVLHTADRRSRLEAFSATRGCGQGARGSFTSEKAIFRVLFAEEGSRGQVLLALEGFNKKTQKTPPSMIKLAKRRLADWRRRGDEKREAQGKRPLHR